MALFDFLRRRPNSNDDASAQPASPLSAELSQAGFVVLMTDLLTERRSERNWRNIKRFVISGSAVILFAIYVGFYVTSLGYHFVPNSDIVGVVRIVGGIEEDSKTASANAVIPALAKAFKKPNVKAVVIAIDSGGGKPGESERIINFIEQEKKATGKQVIAVIGNTGASAAYMIAVHCDKIYAGKYSLVGSVGAILSTWDFHKVAQRFDVERKVYASGSLKGMLDPWVASTPEAESKAHDLVAAMGKTFAKDVKAIRGSKLKPGVDYWTGEVWSGDQAMELGLIDGIDTLDTVIKQTWHLAYYDFGPTRSGGGFSLPFGAAFDHAIEAFADAIYSRFEAASRLN